MDCQRQQGRDGAALELSRSDPAANMDCSQRTHRLGTLDCIRSDRLSPKQVAKSFVTLGFRVKYRSRMYEAASMKSLHLSSRERRELEKQLKHARDVRLYRRTLAVLEFARGRSVTEISRMLRVSRPSVYRWIERFAESSTAESLREEERAGRPAAWTDECSEWLQSLLQRSPAELGYFAVNWTVPLLRDPLQMGLGKRFSDHTIRRGLQRLDYFWKRPRYMLAPDPEREKKTAYSPQNPAVAARLRLAGGRRDRFAVVSSLARQLEPQRLGGAGADLGLERASRRLRRDGPAQRKTFVSGSSASTAARFPSLLELDPSSLPVPARRTPAGRKPKPYREEVATTC